MHKDTWQSIHERRNAAYEDFIRQSTNDALNNPGVFSELIDEAECCIKGDSYWQDMRNSALFFMIGMDNTACIVGNGAKMLLRNEIASIIRSRNPKSEWMAKQRKYEDD